MAHPASIARTFAAAIAVLLFGLVASYAALSFPALSGRVVDDAGILSAATRGTLTSLLAEHERQTKNQVVVVTLSSLQGTTIEQYGYQLGRAWGIGVKGVNNGALLIVSPSTHDVRIEVGYGLEGTLTDAQSKLIIENVMLPSFRKGDYDSGVLNGTITVLQALGGHPSAKVTEPAVSDQQPDNSSGGHIPIIVIIIVLWLVFGRFFWPLFFLGGLGGGWSRGGGFGGGFGGSSGGFSGGGGSFGGGGASGHW
ncbi:MAG: TPM domain-containing protein [Rhizomicrobium sp.]